MKNELISDSVQGVILAAGFLLLLFCGTPEKIMNVTKGGEVANPDAPIHGTVEAVVEKIWENSSAGQHLLASVQNIGFTADGGLALLDRKLFLIHLFDREGEYLNSFGKRGEGPGEIKHLGHGDQLHVTDGDIRISDMGKIHVFSMSGEFLRDIPYPARLTPRGFPSPDTMIAGPEIADSRDQKLELYSFDTNSLETVMSYSDYGVAKGKRKKSRTIVAGGVTPMMRIAAGGNSVYYGLNSIYQIHRLDLTTSTVSSFSVTGRNPRPLRASFIDHLNELWKDYPREKVKRYFDALPDLECHFDRIFLNGEGSVFVSMVNLDEDHRAEFDVFNAEGKYLRKMRLSLAAGTRIRNMDIRGNRIAFSVWDENDEPKVMVYRFTFPDP